MKHLYLLTFLLFFLGSRTVQAQKILRGQVSAGMMVDASTGNIMLETSSGASTFTNNVGKFAIQIQPHDTLSFFYRGKKTAQYLTDTLPLQNFIVPLYAINKAPLPKADKIKYSTVTDDTSFNNVTVVDRSYHADSLSRRKEYGDAFNYTKPKMKFGKDFTPVSVNVGKLAEVLSFKKKGQHEMLKENLIKEEQEGYVTAHFNPTFVKKYLGEKVSDEVLEDYMRQKRPKFEEIHGMSDLEMIDYIHRTYALYKEGK